MGTDMHIVLEAVLLLCVLAVMAGVVQAKDQFKDLCSYLDGQPAREAEFLALHGCKPKQGGAPPHGDASRLSRAPDVVPPIAVGHVESSPPPLSSHARPSAKVVNLDEWVASHG